MRISIKLEEGDGGERTDPILTRVCTLFSALTSESRSSVVWMTASR